MENYVLECTSICKNFGNKKILKNISLHVKAGDILGFIGPNGARKNNYYKNNSWTSKNDFWNCQNKWLRHKKRF